MEAGLRSGKPGALASAISRGHDTIEKGVQGIADYGNKICGVGDYIVKGLTILRDAA
jgi:hypothetical protein